MSEEPKRRNRSGPRAGVGKIGSEEAREALESLGATATPEAAAAAMGVKDIESNQKIVRTETGDINLDETYRNFATLEEARRTSEELDSNLKLAKYQRFRGELVDRKWVEASVLDALKNLLDALQASDRTLAPQLAAITDPKQILRMMEDAQRKAIEGLRATWRVPDKAA